MRDDGRWKMDDGIESDKVRRKANIATIADIIVIIAVTLLNPMLFPQMPPPSIPDKVVKHYRMQLTPDSIQNAIALTEKEIDEMSYYLRLHNVMDDGYNLVAEYNTTLQQRLQLLKKQQAGNVSKTIRREYIAAKNRPMTAVKTLHGYWKAGRYYIGRERCCGRLRQSRVSSSQRLRIWKDAGQNRYAEPGLLARIPGALQKIVAPESVGRGVLEH